MYRRPPTGSVLVAALRGWRDGTDLRFATVGIDQGRGRSWSEANIGTTLQWVARFNMRFDCAGNDEVELAGFMARFRSRPEQVPRPRVLAW